MDKIPESVKQVTINTGNLLAVNDISRKTAQNVTDELCEAILLTYRAGNIQKNEGKLLVNPQQEDTYGTLSSEERSDLKIGVKIFMNSDHTRALGRAVEDVFTTLKTNSIDNVILSYNYKSTDPPTPEIILELYRLWRELENFVLLRKVGQLGLSDVDENTFREIYEKAYIKPSIIQINLATCCVVPPSLQEFCKENTIQLLTHNDPTDILPQKSLNEIFNDSTMNVHWVTRFLIHIRCRGVLTTKGYLINLYRSGHELDFLN